MWSHMIAFACGMIFSVLILAWSNRGDDNDE